MYGHIQDSWGNVNNVYIIVKFLKCGIDAIVAVFKGVLYFLEIETEIFMDEIM